MLCMLWVYSMCVIVAGVRLPWDGLFFTVRRHLCRQATPLKHLSDTDKLCRVGSTFQPSCASDNKKCNLSRFLNHEQNETIRNSVEFYMWLDLRKQREKKNTHKVIAPRRSCSTSLVKYSLKNQNVNLLIYIYTQHEHILAEQREHPTSGAPTRSETNWADGKRLEKFVTISVKKLYYLLGES